MEQIGSNRMFELFFEMINDLTQGEVLQGKVLKDLFEKKDY